MGLPEVAGGVGADVGEAGVVLVGVGEGAGERMGVARNGDEVDVIGHETVASEGELVSYGVLFQESEVEEVVGVCEEDLLLIVAALGDVVGEAGDDDARNSRHTFM